MHIALRHEERGLHVIDNFKVQLIIFVAITIEFGRIIFMNMRPVANLPKRNYISTMSMLKSEAQPWQSKLVPSYRSYHSAKENRRWRMTSQGTADISWRIINFNIVRNIVLLLPSFNSYCCNNQWRHE